MEKVPREARVDMDRKWMFQAEDENGDKFYLKEEVTVCSDGEESVIGETLADAWEEKTGGLILKLTLESHGKVI